MPPNLTNTTTQTTFPITRPNNNVVTYTFNTSSSNPAFTRITLPENSTWTPGLHWHEEYTEYFRVIQGTAIIVRDGVAKIVTPESGIMVVERGVVHEFMRADRGSGNGDSGDVVVEEWTDPGDGVKQVFFRNLLGVLGDAGRVWKDRTSLQIMLIQSHFDDYSVLTGNYVNLVPKWMTWLITHLVYRYIRILGWLLGLKCWYEAYTPTELILIARSRG